MANGIEETITTLYEMVQDAWSLPLGAEKCVVERDKVLDLLDEISNQLPGELKQAKTIVESRNEVITNAKREAPKPVSFRSCPYFLPPPRKIPSAMASRKTTAQNV